MHHLTNLQLRKDDLCYKDFWELLFWLKRYDIENLLRLDPASTYLPTSVHYPNSETNASDAKEVEKGKSNLLLNLRPIKKENLIRDDSKLVLLASLSDSLEFVADFVEGLLLLLSFPHFFQIEMGIADAIVDLVGSGTT
ncbi:unnamed protein product [Cuscuta campestris]|uniref:Exocyst complex component Sec8 n=1 Tax=Cuscuta campestris TaxID=132261 RepID=A0A484KDJ4_9ASTE|nr:unnamed protein product [Cuscuta campestris]